LHSTKKQKSVKNAAVKTVPTRPARKQLQTENSDAVWNELTYLQQENNTLKADKYCNISDLQNLLYKSS